MTLGSNRDWDARSYHQVAAPHASWGASVLDRLKLHGDEVVLDAGWRPGRITAEPDRTAPERAGDRRRPVGQHARRGARNALAPFGDRVTFVETDSPADPASAGRAVDAIFSTATFHWIADHAALFGGLIAVLAAADNWSPSAAAAPTCSASCTPPTRSPNARPSATPSAARSCGATSTARMRPSSA